MMRAYQDVLKIPLRFTWISAESTIKRVQLSLALIVAFKFNYVQLKMISHCAQIICDMLPEKAFSPRPLFRILFQIRYGIISVKMSEVLNSIFFAEKIWCNDGKWIACSSSKTLQCNFANGFRNPLLKKELM